MNKNQVITKKKTDKADSAASVAALREQLQMAKKNNKSKLVIENDRVTAISSEGVSAFMGLGPFLDKLEGRTQDTRSVIFPDGIKGALDRGRTLVWLHQMAPHVRCLTWIAGDSKSPYGPGAKYREVRIAMPYVCVFAVFSKGPRGQVMLAPLNECFFRNEPLTGWDDQLHYPALLNCSKFPEQHDGKPLSWICTANMNFESFVDPEDSNKTIRRSLAGLLSCLWETGFNLSSEKHEGDSWFSETVRQKVDERISSVEAWEKATEQDPLFVLQVPWIPTGKSVLEVAERILNNAGAKAINYRSAGHLARIVFNSQRRKQ